MISIKEHGDYSRIRNYLKKHEKPTYISILEKYGQKGVEMLSAATPVRTGTTASSWSYQIVADEETTKLQFHNSNINNGVPIAVIIQYGHGTGTGGWVEGIDYINPAMQPIFESLADEAWKEVTEL